MFIKYFYFFQLEHVKDFDYFKISLIKITLIVFIILNHQYFIINIAIFILKSILALNVCHRDWSLFKMYRYLILKQISSNIFMWNRGNGKGFFFLTILVINRNYWNYSILIPKVCLGSLKPSFFNSSSYKNLPFLNCIPGKFKRKSI